MPHTASEQFGKTTSIPSIAAIMTLLSYVYAMIAVKMLGYGKIPPQPVHVLRIGRPDRGDLLHDRAAGVGQRTGALILVIATVVFYSAAVICERNIEEKHMPISGDRADRAPGPAVMRWRPMRSADLSTVADLSDVIHLDHPEALDIYAQCLGLYPAGCYVLEHGSASIAGYLVAHPDRLDDSPSLNVALERIPAGVDCYFLHDLAIVQTARGHGMAGAAVERVLGDAQRANLDTIALIAVGNAHGFWARHDFSAYGDGQLDAAKGYGAGARLLVRSI